MTPAKLPGPASPCINICRLDEAGFCLGCRRSMSEITGWTRFSVDQKNAVLAACQARAKNDPQSA